MSANCIYLSVVIIQMDLNIVLVTLFDKLNNLLHVYRHS